MLVLRGCRVLFLLKHSYIVLFSILISIKKIYIQTKQRKYCEKILYLGFVKPRDEQVIRKQKGMYLLCFTTFLKISYH